MRKRRYYIPGTDPITDLIDKQLASLPLDIPFLYKQGAKQFVSSKYVRGAFKNLMEDMFIDAIDKKYNYRISLNDVVFGKYLEGYTMKELGGIFGMSENVVKRIIKNSREGARHGDYTT